MDGSRFDWIARDLARCLASQLPGLAGTCGSGFIEAFACSDGNTPRCTGYACGTVDQSRASVPT